MGQTASGLPIGLQAIGPYLEDRTQIGVAALVAQEFGAFRRPPSYDVDEATVEARHHNKRG